MSRRRDQSGDVAPLLVFALLLLVVAVLAAGILRTTGGGEGPDPAASPRPTAPPADHQLTDTEAIARLAEVDRARIRALEERDPTLLRGVFAPASPAAERIDSSIRTLLKDRVKLEHRRYEVRDARVLLNSPELVRIRQVVVVNVQFRGPDGQNVTKGSGAERQVLLATLKFVRGQWLFADGRILKATRLT